MASADDEAIPELLSLARAAEDLQVSKSRLEQLVRHGVARCRPIGARNEIVMRPAEVRRLRAVLPTLGTLPLRAAKDATIEIDTGIPDLVNLTEAATIRQVSRQALSDQFRSGGLKGREVSETMTVFRREVVSERQLRHAVRFAPLFRNGAGATVLGPTFKTREEADQAVRERFGSIGLELVELVPQFTADDLPNCDLYFQQDRAETPTP